MLGFSSLVAATPMVVKFESLDTRQRNEKAQASSTPIELRLEAEPKQSVKKGIEVNLLLRNESGQPVLVRDVDDLCRLEILDKNGWPVSPPPQPPRLLINNRAKHVDLPLAPNEERRVPFRINRVLANSKDVYVPKISELPGGVSPTPEMTGLLPGEYRVRMYCVLMRATDGGEHFDAMSLRSEFVNIMVDN